MRGRINPPEAACRDAQRQTHIFLKPNGHGGHCDHGRTSACAKGNEQDAQIKHQQGLNEAQRNKTNADNDRPAEEQLS